jgi:hypothetical protein
MYIYVTDFNITPGWDFLQPICFNPTDPSTSSLIADFDYIANCNINTFTAGKESRFGNWFFSENAGIQNSSSYGSVAAVSGSYAALLNATSGTETFIYTILHNMDTGTSYTITFYDRKYTSHNAVDTFEVKIYDGTSWTTIYSTVSSSNSFTQRTCTSFTPSQSTMLLLFVATNTGTYSEERVFLDSIAISPKGTVWNSSYKTSTLKYPTSSVTHIGRFNYPFMNSTSTSLDHAWCENWFFSEQSGIVAASSYGSITPPTGSYSAMLYAKYNTSGYMYTILKGLTTTTSYTITFYNRQYSNPMFDSFTVKVFDSTGTTTTIYSSTAYSTAFVKRTCTAFTPTSSTMGLVFEGKNTGTNQTTAVFIDCVDITYDSNIYLTNSGLTNPVEGSFTTIGNFYGAGAITSTGGSYLGWYLGSNMYISNSVTASPSWSSALRFAPPSAGTTVYAYTVLSGLDTSTAYTVSYYTGKYSSSDTINSSTYSFYVNIYDGTTATRISSATPTSIAFTKQTCDSFVPTASTMMLVFASKDTNAKNTYVGLVKIDKASVSFYSSGITYSSTAISTSSATTNSSLNAPSSLAGSASDGAVSLTWSAPTSGETPSSYTIQVVGSSTFYVSGITGTSKTISGLTNDTTYAFSIKSVNANGSSSYSSSISKTPTSGTVPGAPTSLNCTLGDGSVSLSWSAPSDNGGSTITSYTVTYSDGTTTSTITGLTVLYASVSGLTNGTTYTFYVQAINAIGTGTASSSVSLTVVSYTDLVSAITTSATSVSSTTASTTSSMIVYVQSSDDLSNADANTIQTAVTTYATNATALDNYLSELSAANKALKTAISNAVDSLT